MRRIVIAKFFVLALLGLYLAIGLTRSSSTAKDDAGIDSSLRASVPNSKAQSDANC